MPVVFALMMLALTSSPDAGPPQPRVENGLTNQQIGAVWHAHTADLQRCFLAPNEAGRVRQCSKLTVQLEVDRSGHATLTRTEVSCGDDAPGSIPECLDAQVRTWQFPPSTNRRATRTTMVLFLHPAGED